MGCARKLRSDSFKVSKRHQQDRRALVCQLDKQEWIDSLPENFRNYRAVLWDKLNETLVVVPQGGFNDTLPKIVLRLNQKTNLGSTASVISLGSAKAVNLKDVTQFELLLGDLGR